MKAPNPVLNKYYELWLSGSTAEQIRKSLNLSTPQYNKYTPDFLAYCRHKIKFDTRAQLTNGYTPNLVKLTTTRENEFLQLIASGLSYDKAALVMNVPLVTIMDYWFKDTNFKRKARIAAEMTNTKVLQAFYKRAVGYQYDGGHRSVTRGIKIVEVFEGEGKNREKVIKEVPYESETTVYKINVVEPDVTAGKFWLFNRMPDKFSIDGQRTDMNNKGAILQWIEENTKITQDDIDTYDWEQDEYDNEYLKGGADE